MHPSQTRTIFRTVRERVSGRVTLISRHAFYAAMCVRLYVYEPLPAAFDCKHMLSVLPTPC